MRKGGLKLKVLKNGDVVRFAPYSHNFGHAEFSFLPIWKRGKIAELYIWRAQQENVTEYYLVRAGFSDELRIHGWTHQGVQKPDVWRHWYSSEHRAMACDVYVPLNSDRFTVSVMSSLNIAFELAPHGANEVQS